MMKPILGQWEAMGSTLLGVHPERCICVRNKNAHCMRCADVCTTGAIAFNGETLSLDPEHCIGCGTCATACPTCALEAANPTDRQLSAACADKLKRAGDATLELRCSSNVGNAEGANAAPDVMCMGRLEESLLVELSLRGCEKLVLHTGNCETCPHRRGGELARRVVASANGLLAAFGRTIDVAVDPRRDFAPDQACSQSLLATRRPTPPAAPARFEHVDAAGTLSHHTPSRRARLFKLVELLGQPQTASIDTRLWGEAAIDVDACKSCRMCAVFCPTGALRKFGEDDGPESVFGVEHYPGDCVKCRSCEKICPAGAITISDEVFARELFAGATDAYYMKPVPVKRGQAHTIWKLQQTFCNTDQVYER